MRAISKREQVYAGLFLVALGWGAWNYRHLFATAPLGDAQKQPETELALALANDPAPAALEVAAPGDSILPEAPHWGGDPFNRPWRSPGVAATAATKPANQQGLWLTAIVVRNNQRYAVINGKIVKEGQEVAGRQVTRIEASRVLVDDNGVEVTLTL